MSKVIIEDSTLSGIADAVRTKTGTAERMLPSAMAGLIEGISAGENCPFAFGTFVLNEDTQSIKIEHGLGKTPTHFIIVNLDDSMSATSKRYCLIFEYNPNLSTEANIPIGYANNWATNPSTVKDNKVTIDNNAFEVVPNTLVFRAGCVHIWFAISESDLEV